MNTSLGLLQSVGIGFVAVVLVAVVVGIFTVLTSAIKIIKEYERGVIFRLGPLQALPDRLPLAGRVWGFSGAEQGPRDGDIEG